MHVDFLLERFAAHAKEDAIVWKDRAYPYSTLTALLEDCRRDIAREKISAGSVVSLEGDFSPRAIAWMLALVESGCVVVPLTASVEAQKPEFMRIAEAEWAVTVDAADAVRVLNTGRRAAHPLLKRLQGLAHPGLILFSSGSTGKSKAAVHDMVPLLEKFKVPRKAKRMISFLLFDHIGGVNTLFYALSNAGCIITVASRTPEDVADAVERHRVQILPASPTFINLVLLSGAFQRRDISSLEMVTYGTEPMPEITLKRFHAQFPRIDLLQTYGLSELGIMRSKSKSSDSLWVKVGGEGFETRVVQGLLEIKAKSAMLGYLNAPSPFTQDGWFNTGDRVETDGEFFRILGRESEIINVGGQKVSPAEVESVLQEIAGVEEVVVAAEPNPLMGSIVRATFKLSTPETVEEFRRRLWEHCRPRLQAFQIPQKVIVQTGKLHSDRFKKLRAQQNDAP